MLINLNVKLNLKQNLKTIATRISISPQHKYISHIATRSLYQYKYLINKCYFSSLTKNARFNEILSHLKQQQKNRKLSNINNHKQLIELIQLDISNKNELQQKQKHIPYNNYTQIQSLLISYINQINTNNTINNEYNPYKIKQQHTNLIQLLHKYTKYPSLFPYKQTQHLQTQPSQQIKQQQQDMINSEITVLLSYHRQVLNNITKILYKHFNMNSEEQLNRLLIFVLQYDEKAQQSLVFAQYNKFYLNSRAQYIRAKYQLDFKNGTIWQSIKKIVTNFVHRGYMLRIPAYQRHLQIADPVNTFNYLLYNPSTNNSLLLQKLCRNSIMKTLCHIYQQQCHNNLYHPNNMKLWTYINSIIQSVIFSVKKHGQGSIIYEESRYIVELYIKLFLALRQQQKILVEWFGNVGYVYQWIVSNNNKSNNDISTNMNESQIMMKYVEQVKKFINQTNSEELINQIQIDNKIFIIMKQFPQFQQPLLQKISKSLTPLTFYLFFDKIIQYINSWPQQLITHCKSTNHNNSSFPFLNVISIYKLKQLVIRLKPQKISHQELYLSIIRQLISRNYPSVININKIINLLHIYGKGKNMNEMLKNNGNNLYNDQASVKTLRTFLFRYISDVKNRIGKKDLMKICEILIDINDNQKFNDQANNYSLSIYQELTTLSFFNQQNILNNQNLISKQEKQIKDKIKELVNTKKQETNTTTN